MKVVYYTSSIAGTGRIVRGIAIYNALQRNGIDVDYTILSSSHHTQLMDLFNINHIEIPLEDEKILSKKKFERSILFQKLFKLDCDILIVDRLWFPLYHFIDEFSFKKIFLSLQVHDNFFSIPLPGEDLKFNSDQYDMILAIEPFESMIPMETINPIIIRNKDEILDEKTARERLKIDAGKKTCMVATNHKEEYFEKLKEKYSHFESSGYNMIYTTNLQGGGIFPIVDYFNAIDMVICSAGYNQFWETKFFNKEAIYETYPLRFSSMEWRKDECENLSFDINGADQLAQKILAF